jgi:translation elongation factor EF-4
MNTYDAKHIKNIVLLGSHGCGKTTLAETMLFEAGLIKRRGRVEDKNTVSDFHELEHERGSSVYSTVLHTEWRDHKINIIDTPGSTTWWVKRYLPCAWRTPVYCCSTPTMAWKWVRTWCGNMSLNTTDQCWSR